jgi:hypothetical protein
MDRLREPVRRRLGLASLARSQLLEGATLAGLTIATRLRPPDSPPPIAVKADGTVSMPLSILCQRTLQGMGVAFLSRLRTEALLGSRSL